MTHSFYFEVNGAHQIDQTWFEQPFLMYMNDKITNCKVACFQSIFVSWSVSTAVIGGSAVGGFTTSTLLFGTWIAGTTHVPQEH